MFDPEVNVMLGFGLTVIVNDDVPTHPLSVDVTLIVETCKAVAVVDAVNAVRFPVPLLADKPISVLLLPQANVAPAGVDAKVIAGLTSPPQNVLGATAVIVGFGLTTIRPVRVTALQPENWPVVVTV